MHFSIALRCLSHLVSQHKIFCCFPITSPSQVASILFPEHTIDRKMPQDTYRHSVPADPWSTASVPSHVTAVYVYSYLISGPIVTPDPRINSVKLTMSTSRLSWDFLQAPPPGGTAPSVGRPNYLRASQRREFKCENGKVVFGRRDVRAGVH